MHDKPSHHVMSQTSKRKKSIQKKIKIFSTETVDMQHFIKQINKRLISQFHRQLSSITTAREVCNKHHFKLTD